MEQIHRDLILNEIEQLIKCTKYDVLIDACINVKLISATMRKNIEDMLYPDGRNIYSPLMDFEYEKHKRLFEKITRRGPDAFQTLKTMLSELGYHSALQILNRIRNNENSFVERNRTNVQQNIKTEVKRQLILSRSSTTDSGYGDDDNGIPDLIEFRSEVLPIRDLHVRKANVIRSDGFNGVYPMKKQHDRGIFFMVNIIDFNNSENRRNGAEEDEKALLHIFKEMHFKLFTYNNLTQHQFLCLLDAIIASDEVRRSECFVMALLTHGNFSTTEVVEFTDGSVYKVDDILSRFENVKCPHLVGKPKIFLFPFCRGGRSDKIGRLQTQSDCIPTIDAPLYEKATSKLSDIFICYAALSGHRAHRDVKKGSWYIQEFCKLMADHAHDSHFEDIIKKVQERTAQWVSEGGDIQTGNYLNIAFNKKLYLNPGAWEDNC